MDLVNLIEDVKEKLTSEEYKNILETLQKIEVTDKAKMCGDLLHSIIQMIETYYTDIDYIYLSDDIIKKTKKKEFSAFIQVILKHHRDLIEEDLFRIFNTYLMKS